jgi:uncharacterized protein DUF4410
MNRRRAYLVIAGSLVVGWATAGWAAGKDPMNIEDGALDEIHLKVPALSAGVPILIRAFSTEGVDLGTGGEDAKNEKRSDATRVMVKIAPDLLVEAFKAALAEGGAFKAAPPAGGEAVPEGALVVEGKFLKIDPGSRAKRYLGGFGAGKSGVQVTGSLKDASGKVLAEFTHMKHSGMGIGGGDYVKFLSDDTRDVGRDIAMFLTKWATGKDLHKD